MHHPPPPFIRRMVCAPSVGDFRVMAGQISTAQWKSVMFSWYLTTRPNLHVHRTCRDNLAVPVSMFVHVGWSAVMPGSSLYFMLSIPTVYCNIGENIYQVSIRTINWEIDKIGYTRVVSEQNRVPFFPRRGALTYACKTPPNRLLAPELTAPCVRAAPQTVFSAFEPSKRRQ